MLKLKLLYMILRNKNLRQTFVYLKSSLPTTFCLRSTNTFILIMIA